MQNKGAIKILAILLAVVSLYQLSFTFLANNVRSDAEAFGGGDIVKEKQYLDSISNKAVYPVLGYTYRECQQKELNLGLDLKGGMNVTLEISVIDVIKALSNYSKDATFVKAIALAKEKQRDSQEDFVVLFGQAFKEIDPNANLASVFNTPDLRDKIKYNSTDEDVLKVLSAETQAAIDNSFQILRSRIDRFGVAQPNIQRLETAGRILVELPGVKEPERVRKLLQGTAQLEFWETYKFNEIIGAMSDANNVIRNLALQEENTEVTDSTVVIEEAVAEVAVDTVKTDLAEAIVDTTKEKTLANALLDGGVGEEMKQDSIQSVEQQRKNNPLWSVLYPNLDRQNNPVESASVGFSHFNDTAIVNGYLAL